MQGRQPDFPEIGRLRELLRLMFRVLDVAFRDVEQPLRLGYGYYSKVFTGLRDFRLEHILQFCQVSGLQPAEFFHWAYPRLPRQRSDAWSRLREARKAFSGQYDEGGGRAVEPVFPIVLSEEELGRLSRETREEILELVAARGEGSESPASQP